MSSDLEVVDVQIRVNLNPEVDAETIDQSTRLLGSELREFIVSPAELNGGERLE